MPSRTARGVGTFSVGACSWARLMGVAVASLTAGESPPGAPPRLRVPPLELKPSSSTALISTAPASTVVVSCTAGFDMNACRAVWRGASFARSSFDSQLRCRLIGNGLTFFAGGRAPSSISPRLATSLLGSSLSTVSRQYTRSLSVSTVALIQIQYLTLFWFTLSRRVEQVPGEGAIALPQGLNGLLEHGVNGFRHCGGSPRGNCSTGMPPFPIQNHCAGRAASSPAGGAARARSLLRRAARQDWRAYSWNSSTW